MKKHKIEIAVILMTIMLIAVTSYWDYRGIRPQICWKSTKNAENGFTYSFDNPYPNVRPVVANSTLTISPDSGIKKVSYQWDKNIQTEVSIPADKRENFKIKTIVPGPGLHTLKVTGEWEGASKVQIIQLQAMELKSE